MNKEKSLFFIALLPPESIRAEIERIKSYFARVYQSSAALKSPAHITLQPPFEWECYQDNLLTKVLESFSLNREPVSIINSGFGAFKPRVIYIDVIKTKELLEIQKDLQLHCQKYLNLANKDSKNRSFKPHLTVAYRDLTKANFYKAWQEFEGREYDRTFVISKLTLLKHNGKRWEIDRDLSFDR